MRLCDARAKQKTRGLRPRVFCFGGPFPSALEPKTSRRGDGLGVLFEVEVQHYPVLKDIDRVDEVVDDLPLVSRTVPSPWRNRSNQNKICSRLRVGLCSSSSKMLALRASRRVSSSSRRCLVVGVRMPCSIASSRLDRRFSVSRSCSFRTGRWVFSPALSFQNQIGQVFDDRIVQNQLDRCIHHKALQRFLADRFKAAMCLSLAFGLAALIVVISGAHVAGAASRRPSRCRICRRTVWWSEGS